MFSPITFFLYFTLTAATEVRKVRLVGGIDTEITNFVYQASLARIIDNKHVCGGTIISNQHILTAAHCFNYQYIPENELKVFVGRTHLMSRDGVEFLVEKIFIHPLFKGRIDNSLKFLDDIAIVKLQKSIPFNEFQNKVNLPTKDITDGLVAKLSGWGATTYLSSMLSNNLKEMRVTVTTYKSCQKNYPLKMYHDQFCGFQKHGTGPHSGDSGGPVVADGVIIGVISIAIPEPTSFPYLFTNVYSHLNFIQSSLKK